MYRVSLIKKLNEIKDKVQNSFNNELRVQHELTSDFGHHYYYLIGKRKLLFSKNILIRVFSGSLENVIDSCGIYDESIWKIAIREMSKLPRSNICGKIDFTVEFEPTEKLKKELRKDKTFGNYRIHYTET